MPQFFQNCGRGDIRGRPAGRLSLFLGCARGATGLDFAFCGKRGRGFAPSIPTSLLEKGWIENLILLRCGKIPTGCSNRRCAGCCQAGHSVV